MAVNSALLVAYARAARVHAYCPYSGFPVGAALLASSGEVYCGVNCESASYGATICAERAALTAAVTAGETAFVALAVAAGEEPVPPCGVCRQVMQEFCGPEFPIYMGRGDGSYVAVRLDELLPYGFTAEKYMK